MAKYNITGQVAVLSQQDAIDAKASNAVTDAGYLGGSSWLKSQLDASKEFLKGDPGKVPGYEFVDFNNSKEGLVIPDGAFDFFDLTFDLSQKNIQECLLEFAYLTYGHNRVNAPGWAGVPGVAFWGNGNTLLDTANEIRVPFSSPAAFGGVGNPIWIVTNDYKECGFAGSVTRGTDVATSAVVGYKISGQNPPTDDSGDLYAIKSGTLGNYSHAFSQYKDASDSLTGMRYMVGMYDTGSVLTDDSGDYFVVKSMSVQVDKSTGVNQIVLHCRKAQATTNHTINASGNLKGIHILKLNY